MFFINQWEAQEMRALAERSGMQNAAKAQVVLERLIVWANSNSDGWHSWPKPARAAKNLQEALAARFQGPVSERVRDDLTASELRKVFSPVKAFLTRENAPQDVIFQGI